MMIQIALRMNGIDLEQPDSLRIEAQDDVLLSVHSLLDSVQIKLPCPVHLQVRFIFNFSFSFVSFHSSYCLLLSMYNVKNAFSVS